MPSVCFHTFGCKLNQAETASLVALFKERAYDIVDDPKTADVLVLNTCTVTGRADAKCRQAIRRALRQNSGLTVIVLGCYAQVAREEVAAISGVDYVLGNGDKFRLFDYFPGPGKLEKPLIRHASFTAAQEAAGFAGDFLNHTRAFLKIQDGCDRRCSYCIVPVARGPSRSVPMRSVIRHAGDLVHRGFREIVLTGVHIGNYGSDLDPPQSLLALLEKLIEIENLGRLRLSSLEPEQVTDALLEGLSGMAKICRHLHIPLQSGNDAILRRMGRSYTRRQYEAAVERVLARLGKVGLGTDIIVGFPSETDSQFRDTIRLVQDLPYTYLHVFPYSERRGTVAASMDDRIPHRVRSMRAAELRKVGMEKKRAFARIWVDGRVRVLFEEHGGRYGWMQGFSSEYVRVETRSDDRYLNCLVDVDVEAVEDSTARGRIVRTVSCPPPILPAE